MAGLAFWLTGQTEARTAPSKQSSRREALKTIGSVGDAPRGGREAELFRHDGPGCLTHMWFGGGFPGYGLTRIRVYADGESTPSIDMELMLGVGVGFQDAAAPWDLHRIGKTGHPSGIYNTYRILFGQKRPRHRAARPGGLRLTLRAGEEAGDHVFGDPQATTFTTCARVYPVVRPVRGRTLGSRTSAARGQRMRMPSGAGCLRGRAGRPPDEPPSPFAADPVHLTGGVYGRGIMGGSLPTGCAARLAFTIAFLLIELVFHLTHGHCMGGREHEWILGLALAAFVAGTLWNGLRQPPAVPWKRAPSPGVFAALIGAAAVVVAATLAYRALLDSVQRWAN